MEDASFSHHGLLYGWSSISTLGLIDGKPPSTGLDVNRLIVEPRFFRLFRIPLLAGSNFFRGLALIDLAEAMLKRAFGSNPNQVGRLGDGVYSRGSIGLFRDWQ